MCEGESTPKCPFSQFNTISQISSFCEVLPSCCFLRDDKRRCFYFNPKFHFIFAPSNKAEMGYPISIENFFPQDTCLLFARLELLCSPDYGTESITTDVNLYGKLWSIKLDRIQVDQEFLYLWQMTQHSFIPFHHIEINSFLPALEEVLTTRESEIFYLRMVGFSIPEIASFLGNKNKTVKNQWESCKGKIFGGVFNECELKQALLKDGTYFKIIERVRLLLSNVNFL